MKNDVFLLKVIGREGILFQSQVNSITSYNPQGKFDVLAEHANFISLIEKELAVVDAQGKKTQFSFKLALMKVFENEVKVYLGIEGAFTDSSAQPSVGGNKETGANSVNQQL